MVRPARPAAQVPPAKDRRHRPRDLQSPRRPGFEANAREVQLEEQRVALVEQRLAAQAESMRIRQEMSEARYTAAESQVIVHEVLSGFIILP